MKIKLKITLGITSILIILGIILNISIRNVLISHMENRINSSLKQLMSSSRESIKYRLSINSDYIEEKNLKHESEYLIDYISLNYKCEVKISDMNGLEYSSNIKANYEEIASGISSAKEGKAIANLKYTNPGLTGILSYPININEKYIGIVNIVKNYDEIYFDYNYTILFLSVIELFIFIIIFILSYFMTSKVTKPISSLTSAVKEIGDGNYDVLITSLNNNDEVSILSKEFINMKNKVKEQIDTIQNEKLKVEKLELSRKKFFDTVTHELKTPLTSITGYAEMIKDNIVDDEEFKQRAIERIHDESERLNLLVLDLINVSKGLSTIDENMAQIDMYELLYQLSDDMNIKANKYGLRITHTISKGIIFGQTNKIREVFINILDNAIKYSINSSDITINAFSDNNFYNIIVTNNSEPIPDNIYASIFDPFVKHSSNSDCHSSGLGLYLSSEIIKSHNGDITIKNGDLIVVNIKLPIYSTNNL